MCVCVCKCKVIYVSNANVFKPLALHVHVLFVFVGVLRGLKTLHALIFKPVVPVYNEKASNFSFT